MAHGFVLHDRRRAGAITTHPDRPSRNDGKQVKSRRYYPLHPFHSLRYLAICRSEKTRPRSKAQVCKLSILLDFASNAGYYLRQF